MVWWVRCPQAQGRKQKARLCASGWKGVCRTHTHSSHHRLLPHSTEASLSISSSPMETSRTCKATVLQRKRLFLPSVKNQSSPTGSRSPKADPALQLPCRGGLFYFFREGFPTSVSRHVTLVLPAPWGSGHRKEVLLWTLPLTSHREHMLKSSIRL